MVETDPRKLLLFQLWFVMLESQGDSLFENSYWQEGWRSLSIYFFPHSIPHNSKLSITTFSPTLPPRFHSVCMQMVAVILTFLLAKNSKFLTLIQGFRINPKMPESATRTICSCASAWDGEPVILWQLVRTLHGNGFQMLGVFFCVCPGSCACSSTEYKHKSVFLYAEFLYNLLNIG